MANDYFPYQNVIPPDKFNQSQPSAEIVGGRYELLEIIGQGSMSRVYRARDRVLDRTVAIKLLREEYGSDQNFVARFYREAHAVALLSGPNLVDIYDYGQHEKTYFIAMHYIQGADLGNLLRNEGPTSPAQAVGIITQVLAALAIAHSQGIIHRDVKPQNILIRASDGMVKLTDFGVAYARDGANITTSGAMVGTAYYMAPEQAKSGSVSPATDLYAVGVVLYEMLSGQLPFFGTNPLQVMYQHLNERPPTFASLGVNIPAQLEQVIQRALAKNPSQRYSSATEMRTALTSAMALIAAQARSNVQAARFAPVADPAYRSNPANDGARVRIAAQMPPPAAPTRHSSRALAVILGGLALLLVGGLVWWGVSGLLPSTDKPLPVQVAPSTTTQLSAAPANGPQTTPAASLSAPPTAPTAVATVIPVALPTVTPAPLQPTSTQAVPSTAAPTPIPMTATHVPPPAGPVTFGSINPYDLTGSYKRDDGTLYGRPEVALYGAGTTYNQATVNFNLATIPAGNLSLNLSGIDDERAEHCSFQVLLNGVVIFEQPNTFPNAPTNDNGEGGRDRVWGSMQISIPTNALKTGVNTLTLRNATPSARQIGIPYILISSINFVAS